MMATQFCETNSSEQALAFVREGIQQTGEVWQTEHSAYRFALAYGDESELEGDWSLVNLSEIEEMVNG